MLDASWHFPSDGRDARAEWEARHIPGARFFDIDDVSDHRSELPHMAPEGARLIWGTADRIWTALGDTSDDVNWYTKRATLSGVYAAVVLYWLGDDSTDGQATRAFIDRRISD